MNTRYKIQRELGNGGMAVVYLAEDTRLNSQVALKVLRKEIANNINIHKRFVAEAQRMFRMSHPSIIKVIDLIDDADTLAMVMEYVDGENLKEYIDRKGKLTDDEIKSLFSQMLDALGYVHEQNLVHRDIKPSNFMVDKKGKIKLMDFGIAKTTDVSSGEYTQTGTGIQMGTPMYMSPEQITETKSVTAQSDIYSLGVVLWQMVTGQKPYDVNTISNFQLQLKIVQDSLLPVGNHWDDIINKATSKDPLNRFNNCTEIMNLLLRNKNDFSIENTVIINTDETNILQSKIKIEEIKKITPPENKRISDNEAIIYNVPFEKLFRLINIFMNSMNYKFISRLSDRLIYSKGSALKQSLFGALSPNYTIHIDFVEKNNIEFNCGEVFIKIEVQSLGVTAGLVGIQQRKNEQKKFSWLIQQLISVKN